MFFFVVVMVVMAMFILMLIVIVVVVDFTFLKLLAPSRAGVDLLKIKTGRGKNFGYINISVVGLDNLDTRVQDFNHFADFPELVLSDQILFVDYERGAELNLLDQKRLDVLLVLFVQELVSTGKLINKAGCVNNANNIVQLSVFNHLKFLGDWHWFAHTRGLNHYVVVLACLDKVLDVLRKLAFECAADASVREWNYVACVGDFCSVGNQFGIDIHFADVVYYDGNLVAFLVAQNLVQKRRLTRAKVPAQKSHGCQFFCHFKTS